MANRPSQQQMEALVEFLEQNPGIAKGLLRTQQAKIETRRRWQEFSLAASALGGVIKDGPAWAKYWAEKKCALKRLCQQQAQSMRRTGGGTDDVPQLSPLELRMVAVMGGQSFATGDRGLAVDPFPQTAASSTQASPSILEPSTSQVTIEVLDIEPDTEDQIEPANPVQPAPPQTPRAPRQRARPSRRRIGVLEAEVARFEAIESKRVEAEMLTAQALNKIADAVQEMIKLLAEVIKNKNP